MRISDWSSDVCSSDLFDLASSRRAPASTSTGRIRFSTVSGSGLAVTMTLSRSLTWRSSCTASTAGAGAAPDVVVAPDGSAAPSLGAGARSEEHTSELQSLMRISYAVFCLKKKKKKKTKTHTTSNRTTTQQDTNVN